MLWFQLWETEHEKVNLLALLLFLLLLLKYPLSYHLEKGFLEIADDYDVPE